MKYNVIKTRALAKQSEGSSMPFYHVRIFVEKEEPLQHLYPIVYRDNYELYATSVYGHSA